MKKYLYITILVLMAISVILALALKSSVQERDRLTENQSSLLSDVKYYRNRDSLSTASIARLELTKKEMQEYETDLVAQIKSLNIKLNRLQSASVTATQTTAPVQTIVKDSIIYVEGKADTVSCISFNDPWITLNGCILDNNFKGLIVSKDTIVQVVHRVPREFWFIKYGTKGIRQEITSKNPYTEITYSKYIELVR
jgi:hypothetical protein